MKILFVIGPLKKGGAERVVCNLSNELVKNNEVYIATTLSTESDYPLDKKIKIYCLDSKNNNSFLRRNIIRLNNLKKIIKDNKIDVAISFLPEPSYRLMLAKNKKIKTIISDRNDPNIEYNTFLKRIITKILYNKSDGFVFQTPDAMKFFSKNIQKKSVVIPNPINIKFFKKPFKKERKKVIVAVGRLTEQKNHKLLIQAFSSLSTKYNDFVLKIYGDGELKENLDNYIKLHNLTDKVFLMGNVDNLEDLIYDSSIFVLSSVYEGMPNALMEAMALGLPCISTNCPIGGPKYLIKDGENGLLINVNDKKDLESKIDLLLSNNELYSKISNNSYESSKKYLPDLINNKWYEYILKVMNK